MKPLNFVKLFLNRIFPGPRQRAWKMGFVIFLSLFCVGSFFLGTSTGSVFLIRSAIRFLFGTQTVVIHSADGSLLSGIRLMHLETSRIPKAPQGSRLVVRQLSAGFSVWKPVHPLTVVVSTARLSLPESETLLGSGRYENGRLAFNVYARLADVPEIMRFFMSEEDVRPFSGTILNADLNWLGKWRQPVLRGNYFVQELNYGYGDFSLRAAPGHVDMQFFRNPGQFSSRGELFVQSGELRLRNCVIALEPSRVIYSPDQPYPDLELEGTTVIEGLPIHLSMKGSWRYPDLRLSSDPPLPQEHLLLMVATGHRFKGMEATGLSSGNQLSLDMIGDFIDYAALGGAGSRLAKELGIEGSLVLSNEGRTRELGVRKLLTDKVDIRYGVEQTEANPTTQAANGSTVAMRQKVGADLKITDTDQISVEAEGELSGEEQDPSFVKKGQEMDQGKKVVVTYKKRF